jgi:hypothetical protein
MALNEATNPVQGVSGPGKFSKRTDLEVQSTGYGDKVEYDANVSGATLATAPKNPMLSQAPTVSPAGQSPIDLFAPTAYSDRDVMYGNKLGPQAGPEVLQMQSRFAQVKLSDSLAEMLAYDETGEVAVLYQQALARGM